MTLVYVGTYTDPSVLRREAATPENPVMGMVGPTGSEGIYVYEQDEATGALSLQHTVAGVRNPSFLALDPPRRFLRATDTGADRVFVYRLDPTSGRLSLNDPPWGETHASAGPRHLAFHPNGRFVYANGEADKTLTAFAYDPDRGALTPIHAAST